MFKVERQDLELGNSNEVGTPDLTDLPYLPHKVEEIWRTTLSVGIHNASKR
jgi:hypothetical protein